MENIGLNPNISEYHVTAYSKQLYEFLKGLGVSNEKSIPKKFKNADEATIKNMLKALFKGDGTFDDKGRFKDFYSKSKDLIEDVAECLIKTGMWASIRKREDRDIYELTVSRSEKFWYEETPDEKEYNGKVYDVTVPNGTILVERNGKFMWSSNCAGWSLSKLLKEGFNGVPGRVESKPPKHYDTALLQMANFIGTLQNEWAGAQAFNSMDTLLAPFVREDKLNYKEIKQGMQKFVFNLNIASRWGGQTPFTNLTMDWTVPKDLKESAVIHAGETKNESYETYQDEMDLINKAFLEVLMEGDMNGRPFTFPIPTYNVTDDFNWNSENADLLFEMTAQYGLPYFSNFVNSPGMDPSDIRSMCPIGGEEKVLIKSSRGRNLEYSKIRNIYEGNSKQKEYEIFSDGKFVKGKFDKYPNQEMIEVNLENNHSLKMTKKHLNFVMTEENGEIEELKGEELEEGMYLPYSLKEYEGKGGNQELGYFVGAYAGDGSIDGSTVVFSLNKNQKEVAETLASTAEKYFGSHSSTSEENELLTLKIHSKAAVGVCEDYVSGKGREKHYRTRVFGANKEFRKGVIQGHYDTDGGNRNRIYTSSEKMVESLNMIAATLGTTTSIYTDDREGRLGKEPNYAVLIYQLNRGDYGDLWFKHNQKLWVKIKSIEEISNSTAYCFEVENDEPMFTVGTTGILTHNCRLRLDERELERNVTGGLFGSSDMTGSLGVVTINMPRLGYLSKNEDEFFDRLDYMMVLAKNSLEVKREVVSKNMQNDLLPFSKRYLGSLQNHFSTLGLVGMNEACLNLFGKNIASKEGKDFSIRVLEYMRKRLQDFQEKTGNLYNLEATPAEGTSYRLARIDKKKYPDIITAGEDTPYYTNSSQVPVDATDNLFKQVEIEEDLQTLYTGGTVFHTFLGERMNKKGAKTLVKKLTKESELPYITLTPTYSICPNHGYISGEHAKCPECGKTCEVYSRVVGYYRPVQNWNDGKQEEFDEREPFKTSEAQQKAKA